MQTLLETAIGLFAPLRCAACGVEGSSWCLECSESTIEPLPSRCLLCLKRTEGFRLCPACRRKAPLRSVRAVSAYNERVKSVVKKFKYGRARALAHPIGALMADVIPYELMNGAALVVPVPTATSRRRQRGYDHSFLLAKVVARHSGNRFLPALRRFGQARQVGSGRQTRTKQLEGVFWTTQSELLRGRRVILVDDIATTGATLASAAKTLKRAGAKSVDALVLAHKS